MKILHIGKFYSPIEGGIESINKFIVDSLNGNQQIVISFNNKNETEIDDIEGVKVYRIAVNKTISRQPISFSYYSELKKIIKEFDPDVIHFHHPNPLVAMYLLEVLPKRTNLIVHWHSDVIAQRILHRFTKPIENNLLKRANRIIATSPLYAKNSNSLKQYQDKISIIPCSIDESKFELLEEELNKVNELKEKYGNKPIILFLGRHVKYKGIEYLLKATNYITKDCVILLAGQGPLTSKLKEEYRSTKIEWIGRVSEEEMKIYYNAASILAFPSITKNEAFGVVLAEAMYCGTPAITFTIPGSGVNWVCPNELCGIEVPNKDYMAYAKAIDDLLSNKKHINELGTRAKDYVKQNFVKSVVQPLYLNLYENLEIH